MQVSISDGFNTGPVVPQTAFFSVCNSEKPGLENHAKALLDCGVETIYSSGGTAKYLKEKGVPVIDFNVQVTGKPAIMNHRVATLGYESAGAILARRNNPQHMEEFADFCRGNFVETTPWDIVIVSLYPFRKAIAKEKVDLLDAIENIDIGGPTLLREAAKNFEWVVPVPGISFLPKIVEKLEKGEGIDFATRKELATTTFVITSQYDTIIANFFLEPCYPTE